MLDGTRLAELQRRGWTTVSAAIDEPTRIAMLDRVWEFLSTRGLRRDDPTSWPDRVDKLQPLRNAGVFDAFLGDDTDATGDQLIGPERWTTLGGRPQALITMPTSEPWRLPHKVWHFDLPARGPTDRFTAVRLFGLVDDVGPRGGGTLVVEGSHELVRCMVESSPDQDIGSSSDARRRLREHDFFERLAEPEPDIAVFMEEGSVIDDVPVRVAEVTGRAGDLVVMHPWLLHNLSMNAAGRPRIAMSHSLYATDARFFETA